MTLPRLSANGWLLLIAAVLLVGLTSEQAYRAITGTKSAGEIRHEKEVAAAMRAAIATGRNNSGARKMVTGICRAR